MNTVLSFVMFEFLVILATLFIWCLKEDDDSFLKVYCLIHGFIFIVVEILVFGYCFLSVYNFSFMK